MNHLRGWKFLTERVKIPHSGFECLKGIAALGESSLTMSQFPHRARNLFPPNSTGISDSWESFPGSSIIIPVTRARVGKPEQGSSGCQGRCWWQPCSQTRIINHNLVISGLQKDPWPANICCFSCKTLRNLETLSLLFFFFF